MVEKQMFAAMLIKDPERGGWTKIDIPFDVEKVFASKGYIQVKGSIDNIPFSGIKLMPAGNGRYWMAVSEKLRKAISKGNGDNVSVVMEPDTEVTGYTEPPDFLEALDTDGKANAFYKSLTPASKKWFIMHIEQAKQPATRKTRIEKAISRLKEGKKFHD